MSEQEIRTVIDNYLPQVIHMSLATSSDNKPWVCEVHFAYDDNLNLYFFSSTDKRHSLEIAENPFVAGNIVTQHHKDQQVRGVYFEGKAEIVSDKDTALEVYCKRYPERKEGVESGYEDGDKSLYKITPSSYFVFDTYQQPAGKYELMMNRSGS